MPVERPINKKEIKNCIRALQDTHASLSKVNEELKTRILGVEITDTVKKVRIERNRRLRECDYILMDDSEASAECKAEYRAYRKELRELPNQQDFDPTDFTWPVKPDYEKEIV